jgi:translation elongation factor EF-Tu-like GTPase
VGAYSICTLIAFTQSKLVDDPELLELEELEARELVNLYGFPGNEVACVLDYREARTTRGRKVYKGSQAILECLETVTERRPARPPQATAKQIRAEAYALAKEESFSGDIGVGVRPGAAITIIGGKRVKARVGGEQTVMPGKHGQIAVYFDEPAALHLGQRFVILNDGHIAGACFIKEISERGH